MNMEWIPVKDRLPDKDGLYLVCDKDGIVDIQAFAHSVESAQPFALIPLRVDKTNCFYRLEQDYEICQTIIVKIDATHWMPLPEPPEVKGE